MIKNSKCISDSLDTITLYKHVNSTSLTKAIFDNFLGLSGMPV